MLERRAPSETWFNAAIRHAEANGLDIDVVETRFIDAAKLGASAETAAHYAVDVERSVASLK